MFVGYIDHFNPERRSDPVEHIWMGKAEHGSVVSACGLNKGGRRVHRTRGFDLGVWAATDTVPFRRCRRCDEWRRRVGREALVAEALGADDDPGPPSFFEDLHKYRDAIRSGGATRRSARMEIR